MLARNEIVEIELQGNSRSNVIVGNYIGPEAAFFPGPVVGGGIHIDAPATGNVIGGTEPGAANVFGLLGGNAIWIQSGGNVVQGNLFGVYSGGAPISEIPHAATSCIVMSPGGFNNDIGGTAPGAGNTFAHNFSGAFAIYTGANNRIIGNRIYRNEGLAIDLEGNGVSANDAQDADTGGNTLQNYPVLQSSFNGQTVSGVLDSKPNAGFTLEFFANTACDESGFGEAEVPLGRMEVRTDSTGQATFQFSFQPVRGKPFITATATDGMGNTSELSACAVWTNTPPSFEGGANQIVREDSGLQIVKNWATNIRAGSAEEPAQMLKFNAVTKNPELFAVQPAINESGDLTFQSVANKFGTTSVTVSLQDDGGTDNGGLDTSEPYIFTIVIVAVNDPPVVTPQSLTVNEDSILDIRLHAEDPDSDRLVFTVAPPSHGRLSGELPNLRYQPDTNYFGPDQFVVTASDGEFTSEPAVIAISVVPINDAPSPVIAYAASSGWTNREGELVVIAGTNGLAEVVFDGSATSDVERDILQYVWHEANTGNVFGLGTIATNCWSIGEYESVLMVSDGLASASAGVRLSVLSSVDALALLVIDIDSSELSRRDKRPLIHAAKAVMRKVESGNFKAAIHHLEKMERSIHAESSELAEYWLNITRAVSAALTSGCDDGSTGSP